MRCKSTSTVATGAAGKSLTTKPRSRNAGSMSLTSGGWLHLHVKNPVAERDACQRIQHDAERGLVEIGHHRPSRTISDRPYP